MKTRNILDDLFTARVAKQAKVMFSQASVYSTRGGEVTPNASWDRSHGRGRWASPGRWTSPPLDNTQPPGQHLPHGQHPPPWMIPPPWTTPPPLTYHSIRELRSMCHPTGMHVHGNVYVKGKYLNENIRKIAGRDDMLHFFS